MAQRKKKEGFEDHLDALERIVEELESGDLALDDAMARFQEGVERLKRCTKMLEAAEQQVRELVRDAEGELREQPFDEADA